ncbi:hypothetical protein Ddye_031306 [Dipteronia dyeriana]|uniref:Transposase MuDR plant domain-containing protein n=1 Tax=Dipteronia dyeriana TaxID=168575 RepID=A0AAD9TJ06_9ROSI|nr:hypothetical protein Ddye_031306 [Dipteronia dyeriana]
MCDCVFREGYKNLRNSSEDVVCVFRVYFGMSLDIKTVLSFGIEVFQTVKEDEEIHYQHPEAHNDWAEADIVANGSDMVVNGTDVGGNGPDMDGVNEDSVVELDGEVGKSDKLQRKKKGNMQQKRQKVELLREITCKGKERKRETNIPRLESGDGADIDEGAEDLNNLDGFDIEEIQRGSVSQFKKKMYHEFNPSRDMHDPKFMLGIKFGSVDVFRNAIRAHVVKNKKAITFKKNDPTWIRAICENEGCNWFVYGSWLNDKRTFNIKSLGDKHICTMSFKNKFVNSKMIADKNNMCEAFNSAILNTRDKPMISLMEMIKTYLMKRLTRKRVELEWWKHEIGPTVFKIIENVKLGSNFCRLEYLETTNIKSGVMEMSSILLTSKTRFVHATSATE